MAEKDENDQEAHDQPEEADAALQRALEENRRRSEAMVQAQITNPNATR